MANQFKVTLRSAVDDGTNIFCEMEISEGSRTSPLIRPVFPSGTAASVIKTYMQTIANNQQTLASDVRDLINVAILGA